VQAIILSSDYHLVLDGANARINASYRIQSLSEDWQLIALLGGDARLARIPPESFEVIWRDGSYQLLTRTRGEFEFELEFALSDPATWQDGLRLVPGNAALNRLHVSGIPEGLTARIPGLTPTESSGDTVVYHIAGGHEELILSLEPYQEPESPAHAEPPVPSTWSLQSEVFVAYREGRLSYECRLHCQAGDGSGVEMDLLLPSNALEVTINGNDLSESKIGRRENGSRPVSIRWQTRDILDRVVQLSYTVPQSPLATEWALTAPRVPEDDATRCLFAIMPVDGLELTGDNLKASVQSRRLPEWLRERIASGDFLTAEAGPAYPLQTTWLPRLETAQATVGKAHYETRLVADGALLVEAQFTVTHQTPLAWQLEMPDLEEILRCDVNERSVQPVKRGEQTIEFSLPSSENATSTVSLCYAARLPSLDRVSGRCDLELPRTGLFIHELTWTLTLPDEYVTTAVEGNVTIDRRPAPPGGEPGHSQHTLRLRKDLLRDEHPAVELYYQRRGLDD
jgi:hypothetical protein